MNLFMGRKKLSNNSGKKGKTVIGFIKLYNIYFFFPFFKYK
jgi:hypothetical protein